MAKKYSPKDIAEIKFQVVPNGFRIEEVDTLLDELSEQIGTEQEAIEELNKSLNSKSSELEQLREENKKLKEEINNLQVQEGVDLKNSFSSKNIVKRFANIETKVNEILDKLDKK